MRQNSFSSEKFERGITKMAPNEALHNIYTGQPRNKIVNSCSLFIMDMIDSRLVQHYKK